MRLTFGPCYQIYGLYYLGSGVVIKAAPLGNIVGFHECRLMPGSCTMGYDRKMEEKGGIGQKWKRDEVRVYKFNHVICG